MGSSLFGMKRAFFACALVLTGCSDPAQDLARCRFETDKVLAGVPLQPPPPGVIVGPEVVRSNERRNMIRNCMRAAGYVEVLPKTALTPDDVTWQHVNPIAESLRELGGKK